MKPMSEAAKGMTKAIEYMNEHGWCKSALKNSKGEVCIYGALDYSDGEARPGTVWRAIGELWAERCPNRSIVAFNNHHDTTRADVDKVMQRALSILIQEGAIT